MNYEMRSFTLPASENTSEQRWDIAFLSDEEYTLKYGESKEEFRAGHEID